MSTFTSSIDFSGARGSNTGDQFHELWALQQVLDLLHPETDLKALGVEGIRTESPPQSAGSPTWDGVDCALYYGGTSLETVDRIEFVQLKYSAANPQKAWSVPRLTASTAKQGNNSVIRKMADDFKGAKARIKRGAQLKISLVSNQCISADLKKAVEAHWVGPLESAGIDNTTKADLNLLRVASGLAATDFHDFLETLDFSECGSHSRFAVRERVVAIVAALLGDDVSSDVRDLQLRIRELMLPERAREIVTEKDILLWFGLSGREGLFPCASDIRIPEHTVNRSTVEEVLSLLTKGERLVLVHGVGGCGKTTLMRQIGDHLPEGSVTVFFDCFGGGRYLYSDDKRHLPENAFLHLANELSVELRLPFFIPRSSRYPATIQSFIAKLRSAGEALKQLTPGGILLIIVDAADNSVTAAETADPPERPFIFDLFGSNLSALPENIHIIASCRTDPLRRASLRLPSYTPEVVCSPFTTQETKQNLETVFPSPSDDLVEQFHSLSNANPRVQAYAIAAANGDRTHLLDALLPRGKCLSDVLRASFDNALNKLGQPQIFNKLAEVLAFLPAPIALPSIARITGCTEDIVRDFALDLVPGLRLHGNTVTIADEDFDAFIKNMGSANRVAIIAKIAADFISTFQTDSYSSIHVADALIGAGRAGDILSVIERDPQAGAIGDPIVRRQVQVRRLKHSLAACREAGSTTDALKTVLISAEAKRDDSTLNDVLEKELDLSVEFAGSSLRRTILLDRDRVEKHGSYLAQDAVRAIRAGDRITAREQLYFHDAWLRHRHKIVKEELRRWNVTDRDVSARVETILDLAGPKAALNELIRWTPRDISLRVAFILVPQLIVACKVHHINALLKEHLPSGPWDLLLWVPLAMAGESVDGLAIEKSLRRIRRIFIPKAGMFRIGDNENGWQVKLLDTFITACELAFKLNLNSQTILDSVNRILEVLEGKQKRRIYGSDVYRIDGLLRCWLLKEAISGRVAKDNDFILYVKILNPEPKPQTKRHDGRTPKQIRSGVHQTDNREVERLNKKILALFPVYSARLEIITQAKQNEQISDEQLKKLESVTSHAYDFDSDPDSASLRDVAARSVMDLLFIGNIEASELVKRASSLAKGRFSDMYVIHRQKLWFWMRLRTSESDKLILLVAEAVRNIKGLRAASSDKLEAIISMSRLILPVSRDDAESLFNDAVNIAKEIDQEAVDQIDFVSVLAERARIPDHRNIRKISSDIFAFVSGAAERLSDRDSFPWREAVQALTSVEDKVALSAISRWADDGTVSLDDTLNRFLLTALHRGIIGIEVATSLTMLIEGAVGSDLRKELVSRAVAEPRKYNEVIEELAKDTLLLSPQDARFTLGQDIADLISPNAFQGGPWFESLRDTIVFLRQRIDNNPEGGKLILPDEELLLPGDSDFPKEFEFDPQGRSFATPESMVEVLQAAKTSGLRYRDRDLLRRMRDVSSNPRDRIPFLNALAGVPEGLIWSTDRIEMINETLVAWKGTPAVDRWCKETLASVLVSHFHGATWLKEGQAILLQLLDYTGLDADGRLQVILAGVAKVGEALKSRTLFAIAEEIACYLEAEEAGSMLLWYAERLRSRLPAEDQSLYSLSDLPDDKTEAIARFLFALMSDIDTRIRWKAAHALRRLSKLGCFDIIKATVSQSNRVKDDAFRDPTGPYYFLAAKLWLTISLYRISAETPESLSSCKAEILELAISSELPHVGIREYAKRTLLQLASNGAISLTSTERKQIDQINTALHCPTDIQKQYRSFDRMGDDNHRFKFDYLDTIPYWYEEILRIFPTVSTTQVLDIAERWILDKWKADPEANWWDKEPRKKRYNERRYGLWTHNHGSLPTVERYGTYLEWNAMHCVVGELLTTHPISQKEEYEWDNFNYWLGKVLLSDPPAWLSDYRGPTPLEARLWEEDPRTDRGWLHNVRRGEFLNEVGTFRPNRRGWIVVNGYYSTHSPKREATIRIKSALVQPETAPALVRAFQASSNPWDVIIPDENDNLQIDAPPYRLLGWLRHIGTEIGFDDNDPYRYQVGPIRIKPSRKLTEVLGLVPQAGIHRTWICNDTGEAALIYEAWCDEPPLEEREYYPRGIRSDGWRLWARVDMVHSFLVNEGWDLICDVQIERQLRNEYGRAYETNTKRKTHDKILLLRADGSVADAKGSVGSWAGVSRGARS